MTENTAAATQGALNGIDAAGVAQTVQALETAPELARFQFRASNRWVNGAHSRTTIKELYGAGSEDDTRTSAFILEADEPKVLFGTDVAPNPVEIVLHGLAACLTTTLVFEAVGLGIRLESVESKLEGDVDLRGSLGIVESIRNGFEEIRVTFRIKADAPPDQIRELCALAQKHSAVFDIVTNPVPVHVELVT